MTKTEVITELLSLFKNIMGKCNTVGEALKVDFELFGEETDQIENLIMDIASIKADGHRSYLREVFWQFSEGELTTEEMIEQIMHVDEIVSPDFDITIQRG